MEKMVFVDLEKILNAGKSFKKSKYNYRPQRILKQDKIKERDWKLWGNRMKLKCFKRKFLEWNIYFYLPIQMMLIR